MVALALFAGVVLGVMSLFPSLHQQAQESEQSTHATFIAQRIFETLKATAPQGGVATGPAWKNDPRDVISLSLKTPSTHFIAYGSKDQPVRLLTAQEYAEPLRAEGVIFIVRVEVITEQQPAETALVEVTIATPVVMADKRRHHFNFVTQM